MMAGQQGGAERRVNVDQVCQLLHLGLAENRLLGIQQVVDDWCEQHKVRNFDDLTQKTAAEPALYQSLIDAMMVAETYFFRHSGHFDFVRQHILPCFSEYNRPLRILSGGCATGEEAYSLAILLATEMPDRSHRIFACDISEANIRAAKLGVYKAWSFREPELWQLTLRYLDVRDSKTYQVKPAIKEAITFFCCNLTEDLSQQPMLSGQYFDLIFCRNMLIYLTDEEAQKLSQRLISLLAPHGWLVPGPSDPISVYLSQLSAMESSNGLVFRQLPALPTPPGRQSQPATAAGKKTVFPANKQSGKKTDSAVTRRADNVAAGRKALRNDDTNSAGQQPATLEQQINNLLQTGDADAALARIHQQLRSMPLCAEAYLLQALIYWQLDQYDGALTSLDKALYLAPDSPLPYYLSAKVLQNRGQAAQARRQLLRAQQALARLDQKQPLPLMRLGTVAELTSAVNAELAEVNQHTDLTGSKR